MVCSTKKVHEEIIKDLRLYQLLINCTKCDCRNDYLYLSDLLIRVERNKSDQFCRFWAVVQSKEKVIQTKLSTKPILIIQKCDRVRDSLIVCRMGNWKTLAMALICHVWFASRIKQRCTRKIPERGQGKNRFTENNNLDCCPIPLLLSRSVVTLNRLCLSMNLEMHGFSTLIPLWKKLVPESG